MFVLKRRKVRLMHVAFSPSGTKVAAVGDRGTVLVWDLATRALAADVPLGKYTLYAVAFLDETRLAVTDHHALHVRDLSADGAAWARLPLPIGYNNSGPIVSPDRTAVTRADVSLARYNLADPPALAWEAKSGRHHAWSPCSRFLILGNADGTLTLLDAATGSQVRTFGEPAKTEVTATAVAPGGQTAAWAASSTLHIQRTGDAVVRHRFGRAHFNGLAFLPTAPLLATANGDGKVDYWDLDSGERRYSFEWSAATLNHVAFADGGDLAACCSRHGEVVVWDVDY